MKRLYFVRHGESELNSQHIYSGQTNTPLTRQGREQARLAAIKASTLRMDLMVSSPLIRTLETARIIALHTGYPLEHIITNQIFVERSLGPLEGRSWDEVSEDQIDSSRIETLEDLLKRAQSGLDYLRDLDADNILLVGHGSFSRALRLAIDPRNTYGELANAEIIQLI